LAVSLPHYTEKGKFCFGERNFFSEFAYKWLKDSIMDESKQFQLQKLVIDQFKDTDDQTLIDFMDSFVYHRPAKNDKISTLIEDFIKRNGLTTAYTNYLADFVGEKTQFFRRSQGSEITMIENIKAAFMNAAYNRFRVSAQINAKQADLSKTFQKVLKSIDKLLDAGRLERFDEAIDELKEIHFEHKKNENRTRHRKQKAR